jgi:hypothetical protein
MCKGLFVIVVNYTVFRKRVCIFFNILVARSNEQKLTFRKVQLEESCLRSANYVVACFEGIQHKATKHQGPAKDLFSCRKGTSQAASQWLPLALTS